MTDTAPSSDSNVVDSPTRLLPAMLLRGTLVLGTLLVGVALTLDGPTYLLRGDLVAGVVVAASGGYVLTRLGRGDGVSPLFAVIGMFVGVWLVIITGLNGIHSPLARASIVLGGCDVVICGLLYRAFSRSS